MQRTSRRRFIAGIGAVSTTAISAGCSGGGGGDSGGGDGGGGDSGETTASGNGGGGATTAGGEGGDDGTTADGETTTGGAMTTGGGGGGGGTATVAAGPDGSLVFDPEQVQVSVGDTVIWEFKSAGHNVSARPQDGEKISIPDGAEPFASYENGNTFAVVEEGGTYEYTFETPGEYTYVCIPHASSGMVGTVTVSQ